MKQKSKLTAYVVREPSNRIPSNHFLSWLKEKMPSEIKIHLHHRYYRNLEEYFSSDNRFLSSFITKDDIRRWNPSVPILISAQTGTGKNTFIQRVLLKYAVEHTTKKRPKDLVLILSNRIALGRQSKRQFAERVAKYMANSKHVQRMDEYYTPEGVDNLYIDMDIVTVCSYHQLFERKLLNEKKFDYIICDEAHFFTSDATFNHNTDEILKYIVSQGNKSTRIYMTATMTTVFEAIIREEHAYREDFLKSMDQEKEAAVNNADFRMLKHNETTDGNGRYYAPEAVDARYQAMRGNFLPLHVEFYYTERHYEYIDKITVYHSEKDLAEKVIASEGNGKWLIFVSTRKFGKTIQEEIDEKSGAPCCTFISAESKSSMDADERKMYNEIIENEGFSQKVLITTSVLDNGVNLRSDVRHVAIDAFDRIQFLQMIGRVRIEHGEKLHLYIKEHTNDSLKSRMKSEVVDLMKRLELDMRTDSANSKRFNSAYHRLAQTDMDGKKCVTIEYNTCAVYQLLDAINHKMGIIHQSEPEFFLDFEGSRQNNDLRRRIYQDYCNEHREFPWSRNVVDILEEAEDAEDRRQYGVVRRGWEYTFGQTFERYFFGKMLPEHLEQCIENTIKIKTDVLMGALNPGQRNEFCARLDIIPHDHPLSEFEKLQRLSEFVRTIQPDMLSMEFKDIELLQDKIKFYKNLVDDNTISEPLDEQLRWLEKLNRNDLEIDINTDDIQEYIRKHGVSKEELESKKSGQYYDRDFLRAHGIPIRKGNSTSEETAFSKKYFGGKPLRDQLHGSFKVGDANYLLESCSATGEGHTTYYLFVRTDSSLVGDEAPELDTSEG